MNNNIQLMFNFEKEIRRFSSFGHNFFQRETGEYNDIMKFEQNTHKHIRRYSNSIFEVTFYDIEIKNYDFTRQTIFNSQMWL